MKKPISLVFSSENAVICSFYRLKADNLCFEVGFVDYAPDIDRDSGHTLQMTDFISFETLTRPSKPNTYLVAPAGLCKNAEADTVGPSFPNSPRGLFSQLSELIATERRWRDLKADPETLRLKFIARTPLLGFRDDVDIAILPAADAEAGSTLAIYSRSRLGHSDLGANKKRVSALLDKLTAK